MSLKESKRRIALRDAVKEAELELQRAQHEYLREAGWIYTSETPGCLCLWQKTLPKPNSRRGSTTPAGRIALVSTSTALAMQRGMDFDEIDGRAFGDVE